LGCGRSLRCVSISSSFLNLVAGEPRSVPFLNTENRKLKTFPRMSCFRINGALRVLSRELKIGFDRGELNP
jgi:hypothetical protein